MQANPTSGLKTRNPTGSLRRDFCKKQITIRFDKDLIDWFKAQGKGYQTHMNAALRDYMAKNAS